MSIAPSVNASVTQEVKLTPSQARKLRTELKVLSELRAQRKAIEQAESVHKEKVEALRAEVGAEKIELDGYKIAFVQGVRTALDKEMLLRAGCSMAMLEAGTKTTPITAYTKVTFPNEKGRD